MNWIYYLVFFVILLMILLIILWRSNIRIEFNTKKQDSNLPSSQSGPGQMPEVPEGYNVKVDSNLSKIEDEYIPISLAIKRVWSDRQVYDKFNDDTYEDIWQSMKKMVVMSAKGKNLYITAYTKSGIVLEEFLKSPRDIDPFAD